MKRTLMLSKIRGFLKEVELHNSGDLDKASEALLIMVEKAGMLPPFHPTKINTSNAMIPGLYPKANEWELEND